MALPPKKLKPFLTHLNESEHVALKKFARVHKMTMAKVIREAILMRLAPANAYMDGYNAAITDCGKTIQATQAGSMTFPSGLSFADHFCGEIFKLTMKGGRNEDAVG
jgi:hypothetical protein